MPNQSILNEILPIEKAIDNTVESKLSTALAILRVRPSLTVDELADTMDLSKTAGRARLLGWEADGWIVRDERRSDGPGRPPLAFRITEKGSAVFPTDDAALLTRLLGHLAAENPGVTEQFFDQVWSERAAQFEALVRARIGGENPADCDPYTAPLDVRMEALTEVLQQSGFVPRVEVQTGEDGTRVQVSECNCPLVGAARATRIPCERETQFLARVVGVDPEAEIHIERRTPCKFRFHVPLPQPK